MNITLEHIQQEKRTKLLQREQTIHALQQIDAKGNELRQRVLLIDGSVAQLTELEALLQTPDSAQPIRES